MSVDAITYVKTLDLGECESAAARLLMVCVAENTFNDSGRCIVGQEQLAYECGRISTKTVSRHLDALECASTPFIRRKQRFTCDGRRDNDEIEIIGFKDWYDGQHAKRKGLSKAPKPADKLSGGGGGRPPDRMSDGSTGQNVGRSTGQQVSGY